MMSVSFSGANALSGVRFGGKSVLPQPSPKIAPLVDRILEAVGQPLGLLGDRRIKPEDETTLTILCSRLDPAGRDELQSLMTCNALSYRNKTADPVLGRAAESAIVKTLRQLSRDNATPKSMTLDQAIASILDKCGQPKDLLGNRRMEESHRLHILSVLQGLSPEDRTTLKQKVEDKAFDSSTPKIKRILAPDFQKELLAQLFDA